ncbi:M20/M25/M40 family metallo-hydrolase [Alteromonas pelagimontana]|uniref:M20/M25/M40 family metallo-hydrolase n=1 Tax=Alteromonas pelagimontana TaxID=1858656 RepID=A0A6M4MCC2_9ALTE|nr:M20/M25/M40 family metallo-hydrolase [Alteromonas pelagimontana]QJR80699.1 M20/M25/M40 family metallo-hydrolase [Alteromonas pelagimontana]
MKCRFIKQCCALLVLVSNVSSAWAAVSSTESKIVKHIDNTHPEAVKLLEKVVNINSGTMNFAGVRQVADVLIPEFEKLGFDARFEDGSAFNRAGHLVAELNGGKGPKLLLIGHLDTVFEPDSPFQKFEYISDNVAKGPGIADMKGGDIVILQSLRALQAAGELIDMNIMVVMTGDEELSGRPLTLSKKALIDGAKWADIAIGFENGDGNPKTANISRRGSIDWTLNVKGVPSHSSQIFKDDVGAGAIYEAARVLNTFYTELREEKLLTYNPGRIMGGTTVTHNSTKNSGTTFGKNNVVAETAIVTGDIRGISEEQVARVKNKMEAIVASHLPQTQSKMEFGEGYPPLAPTEGNKKLLSIYSNVSEELGFGKVEAVDPLNAGAADVSFTSAYVDMAIDGLGMSGTAGHTVEEKGNIDSLSSQAKRAAVLMYRLKSN